MVEKNRTRLRQFDLPANVRALLKLPDRVFQELKEGKSTSHEDALRAMRALAVVLLTKTALRIGNLTALEFERHFVAVQRGRNRNRHIVIPAREAKTPMPFEMELPEETGKLLDIYLNTYRPLLTSISNPLLFPGPSGRRRSTVTFSQSIKKFILRETGLVMNVHLFRHLAAKLHLTAHPDDIETVRRILGHTSSLTTTRAYGELRTDQALKRYDETLAELHQQQSPVSQPRSPGRNKDKRP